MALVPIISGSGFYDRRSIASAPALPVWTYTAEVPASGKFTANSVTPSGTTLITFSEDTKYGPTSFTGFFSVHFTTGTLIYMTASNGSSSVFHLTGNSGGGIMAVEALALDTAAVWSGDYQVFFIPPTNVAEALNASNITPVANGSSGITAIETNTGIVTAVTP